MPHSHHFTDFVPFAGTGVPPNVYGLLVGEFQFASHVPLQGGTDTGRHIYLALKVAGGESAGLYECAFNIRSDEGTNVKFADGLENLDASAVPKPGFQAGVKLAYGSGSTGDDSTAYLGLADGKFGDIENDELYDRVSKLTEGCDVVAVYGVTYKPPRNDPHGKAHGIHDVHMNSGTDPADPHARDDRDREDGAMAFYFDVGGGKAFAHWLFVKFKSQTVVNHNGS